MNEVELPDAVIEGVAKDIGVRLVDDKPKRPAANHLINRTAVREYALAFAAFARPGWRCERVSAQWLDYLESRIAKMIRTDIQQHPTKGRTLKPD